MAGLLGPALVEHDLDRDLAIELLVVGRVHRPHAAAADAIEHGESSDANRRRLLAEQAPLHSRGDQLLGIGGAVGLRGVARVGVRHTRRALVRLAQLGGVAGVGVEATGVFVLECRRSTVVRIRALARASLQSLGGFEMLCRVVFARCVGFMTRAVAVRARLGIQGPDAQNVVSPPIRCTCSPAQRRESPGDRRVMQVPAYFFVFPRTPPKSTPYRDAAGTTRAGERPAGPRHGLSVRGVGLGCKGGWQERTTRGTTARTHYALVRAVGVVTRRAYRRRRADDAR